MSEAPVKAVFRSVSGELRTSWSVSPGRYRIDPATLRGSADGSQKVPRDSNGLRRDGADMIRRAGFLRLGAVPLGRPHFPNRRRRALALDEVDEDDASAVLLDEVATNDLVFAVVSALDEDVGSDGFDE